MSVAVISDNALLAQLPAALDAEAKQRWQQLCEALPADLLESVAQQGLAPVLLKVCLCSRFVCDTLSRHPQQLHDLLHSGDVQQADCRQHYAMRLNALSSDCVSDSQLATVLRQFRQREMVRIAWRDLAGWADLDETLQDLSALAEACIETALNHCHLQLVERFGQPTLVSGEPFGLVVLGMGKLGAWELNFSSDIDLIFAYAEDGELTGRKALSYAEFFTRLSRSLVKLLDEITVDGFVFRTDTRLRPFGDSGPLVMSFDGMEQYYLTQGREWERYAMIKARQVAGDKVSGTQLASLIKPFVYRRYLDYGAFDSLRKLKQQINQEVRRRDRHDNVKLGAGGIREVEFIGQAFQLIRGGQTPALQVRPIQTVLKLLPDLHLMPQADVDTLIAAYRFLRRVENHIQQYHDKQTHDLPNDAVVQQLLAYSMDYADWEGFKQALDTVRQQVHGIFQQVFSLTDDASQPPSLNWMALASNDEAEAVQQLSRWGFDDTAASMALLTAFNQAPAMLRMTENGLNALQRLLPLALAVIPTLPQPERTLQRLLCLLEAVAGRNVYLALLAENPRSLDQLLQLIAASPWISAYLAQYPVLFDELMDARRLYQPLHADDLAIELQQHLDRLAPMDEEQLLIALRQFKHLQVLRVAASDIMAVIPLMVVSDYLSWIAEALLAQVLNHAWQQLVDKHGLPPACHDDAKGVAIIGLGKLGGLELGYGSDLDVVFLVEYADAYAPTDGAKAISTAQFYLRLAQKIRHMLEVKLLSGQLYEVDLRLRPNGESGLLVSPIADYAQYQQQQAWTWEHQALVRGRFVAGDSRLKTAFESVRHTTLCMARERAPLQAEVGAMRQKMRAALAPTTDTVFDVKHSAGGMVDIEFMVQYAVLAHSAAYPALTRFTDNMRLLDSLAQCGLWQNEVVSQLKAIYAAYRDYGHKQVLQGEKACTDTQRFALEAAFVRQQWQVLMETAE